jgi:hypothetical protein
MDQSVGEVLGAWAELEGGDELGLGIEGDPDPEIVGLIAESGVEFIELEMANVQVAEEVRMNLVGVRAGAGEPEAQGGVGMAKETLDIGYGEAQIDGQEDAPDVPGGSVEAVESGAPAAGEAGPASLAFEVLDTISNTIPDEGMESGVGVAPIVAEEVGAGTASGADAHVFASSAFALGPGFHPGLVSVAPERLGMGVATNGAVEGGAGLQGARLFGEIEWLLAEFTSALEQLQDNEERYQLQGPINCLRPDHEPSASSEENEAGGYLYDVKWDRVGRLVRGNWRAVSLPQSGEIILQ